MRSEVSWQFVSCHESDETVLEPSAGARVYRSGLARVADVFACGMMVSVGFNVWEAVG